MYVCVFLSTLFLETGSLIDLEFVISAGLAGQRASRNYLTRPLSPSPGLRLQMAMAMPNFCMDSREPFAQQTLTPLGHLSPATRLL